MELGFARGVGGRGGGGKVMKGRGRWKGGGWGSVLLRLQKALAGVYSR